MYRLSLYIVLALLFLIIYVKFLESRSIFFPLNELEFTPEDFNLHYDDIYFLTSDNVRINGWFIPSQDANYTLLFFHGNAGNISHRLEKIIFFNGLKLNVFIIDYRGYGKSRGKPREKGLYTDAQASYEYLVEKYKIDPENIILYGESLGSAVAIDLALKVKVRALILEGAFPSIKDLARSIYPFISLFLFTNKFDSLGKIKNISVPKLFLHSRDDEIVPFKLAQKFYNKASEPKQLVELRGGHNSAFLDSQEKYIASLRSFINSLS